MMDEIWVPNTTLRQFLMNDGISNAKVKVVPYAADLDKYNNTQASVNFGPNEHKFKFYFIGDLNDRKNIE
jgi:sulfur relay (sulfurtransferase) complex TusBCD TusD component (DsrE family)